MYVAPKRAVKDYYEAWFYKYFAPNGAKNTSTTSAFSRKHSR